MSSLTVVELQRTRSAGIPTPQRGFVLPYALLMTVFVVTIMSVSLTRTASELRSAQRFVAKQQAFYLAEGALDAKIRELAQSNLLSIAQTELISGGICSNMCYKVDMIDLGGGIWEMVAQGSVKAMDTNDTIRAAVQQAAAVPPSMFDYAVASAWINMDGNTQVGDVDPGNRVKLHVQGVQQGKALVTSGANRVWASHIDFVNPENATAITDLCPNCANPTIFPPSASFTYDLQSPPLPPMQVDLLPYYTAATSQQSIDGRTYHHITADQTFTNAALDGTIYIECGVKVTFDGISVVRGTIVHEGCNGGEIRVAHNAELTIDSYAQTDLDANGIPEEPVAKGMAMLSAAGLSFTMGNPGTTLNVTGFVITSGYTNFEPANGTVRGGLITIEGQSLWGTYPLGVDGPGTGAVIWPFYKADLTGNGKILFQPLPATPIGFSGVTSQSSASNNSPAILSWQSN